VSEDKSLTLATANDQVLVLHGAMMTAKGATSGPGGTGSSEGPSYTLVKSKLHGVMQAMQVRRLTPGECEALQGFPRGYTNIPWRGKPEAPDGPRYKALGNSWAVPCARYIGEQIQRVTTP
jgi:DNA (cytosine-5)-methyltransferase 1